MAIVFNLCPPLSDEELNTLFASAWTNRGDTKPAPLDHALFYACAFDGTRLIGFAKVIGDGGVHGFLLDPTVAPEHQRKGIGRRLIEACATEARRRGVEWLHVDFEPRLADFYRACGFSSTPAGLRNLKT